MLVRKSQFGGQMNSGGVSFTLPESGLDKEYMRDPEGLGVGVEITSLLSSFVPLVAKYLQ